MSELHIPGSAESVQLSSDHEGALNRYVAYITQVIESKRDTPQLFSGEERLRVLALESNEDEHERGFIEWGEPGVLNRLARDRIYAALGATLQYPIGLVVHALGEDMVQFVQPVTLADGFAIEERTDYLNTGGKLNALCSELFLVYQPS